MIRLLVLALVFSSLPSFSMASRASVLVVGAGPAGLAAAQRLTANNFAVTILEKNSNVGGKCLTVPCKYGKGVVELGAIQVGIGYPKVNFYRKEMGLKLRKYWPSRSLRYRNSNPLPIYTDLSKEYWPLEDSSDIAQEVYTMSRALARFADFNDHNFVNMESDAEFTKPFEEWADDLGLKHFKEDFRVWITSYGYGMLNNVPAFLPLSLINSSFGLVFMRRFDMNLRMLEVGYGGLLERMVDHYQLDVRYGAAIHNIERGSNGVRVTFSDRDHGKITHSYDHLILACGMDCAGRLLDKDAVTPEERELFDNLKVAPYDVVIAHIPGLEKGGYVLPQLLHKPGHVSLISKNSAQGDDVILYVPREGETDVNGRIARPSEQDLSQVVIDDMKLFGLDDVEIIRVQFWDNYFEHWADPKFYKMLNDIQGQNSTYYIGAMARFEIVERAMEHAHDVVDEHILGIKPEAKSIFGQVADFAWAFYEYATAEEREEAR